MPKPTPLMDQEEAYRRIVAAAEDVRLESMSAWNSLEALSDHTIVDGVEVDPAGIVFETAERFRGVMSIYLVLNYAPETGDHFETSESFLGKFNGHFDQDGNAQIDEVSVDTSPFYEGESLRVAR